MTDPEDLVLISRYEVLRREITIKGSFAEINRTVHKIIIECASRAW